MVEIPFQPFLEMAFPFFVLAWHRFLTFCVEQRLEAFSTPNSMRLICLQHQRMFRGVKKTPWDQTGHALDEMQFVNFITAFVRGLGSAFGIVNKEWMF